MDRSLDEYPGRPCVRRSVRTGEKKISEKELVNLSMAVTVINSWNHLNIALRTVPGGYKPAKAREMKRGA